jgi:hypothetical protein
LLAHAGVVDSTVSRILVTKFPTSLASSRSPERSLA